MTTTTTAELPIQPLEALVKCDLYFEVAKYLLVAGPRVGDFGERLVVLDDDWTICANADRFNLMAEPVGCESVIIDKGAIVAWNRGIAVLEIFPHAVTAARTSEAHDGGQLREALDLALKRITH